LGFILRHCGVRHSMPHSSGVARLACGHFTKPSPFMAFKTFYKVVILHSAGRCSNGYEKSGAAPPLFFCLFCDSNQWHKHVKEKRDGK
jgi:hypothetical protein